MGQWEDQIDTTRHDDFQFHSCQSFGIKICTSCENLNREKSEYSGNLTRCDCKMFSTPYCLLCLLIFIFCFLSWWIMYKKSMQKFCEALIVLLQALLDYFINYTTGHDHPLLADNLFSSVHRNNCSLQSILQEKKK